MRRIPAGTDFNRIAGVAALVISVLLAGEVAVYTLVPRAATAAEHFQLFRDSWLAGLLSLDLLGMIAYVLFIPVMLALYRVLRDARAALAAFAAALFFVGIAEFYATNTSFSMLALSGQYAAARTEAERALLLAAGHMMLTQFNENAFLVSYVLVSGSWAMTAALMLGNRTFGRFTAWSGILAGGSGILAVVFEHALPPAGLPAAIALYFAAIVFLGAWVVLVGRRLLGSVASSR